jgi:THO complex subunit 2
LGRADTQRPPQVRVNTKLVYNQQKYNLLREESEGYAKVLTVLNNFGATALSDASAPDVVVALQSLIGCFDLDPNRVFDLVLDRRAQCGIRLRAAARML